MVHTFRENISDKRLRQFFNERNQTPNKRYRPAEYAKLRLQYQDLLDKHREQQKKKKNEAQKIKRGLVKKSLETLKS